MKLNSNDHRRVEMTEYSVKEVLASYKHFLAAKDSLELKLLERREKSDPAGVRAEALMFSYLRSRGLQPQLIQDPIAGTPDYICRSNRCSFGCTYLCGLLVVGWPTLFVLLPKGIPAIRFDIGPQLQDALSSGP